jgi:hypothetical protein
MDVAGEVPTTIDLCTFDGGGTQMGRVVKFSIVLAVVLVGVASTIPAHAVIVFNPANNHWYAINTDLQLPAATFPVAFSNAASATLPTCVGCISYLATLTSLAENQFVATTQSTPSGGPIDFGFFGLSQPGIFTPSGVGTEVEPGTPAQGAQGQWTWASGTEPFYQSATNTAADVIFHNWRVGTGEPNNGLGGGEEDAAEWAGVDGNGVLWNDVFNPTSQDYLIEFQPRAVGVPEPGSLLLIGSGIAGLSMLLGRKRRQK